ncbi:hypothetical protein M527_07005 [Sphingobium indicum IP26]|uniref:Uncharacterized protein n=1 Tax=Sphingobium indicum F2 TaxID=1450518 RepID=A0A8E0WSN5_9SPHN|nr:MULTISPECIES: hypothetical protein [Sphingobium]EPR09869.1 hypothetical protein M527_07005 [Sphingobium indicum IP26]EQB04997.1 hypothetical protein L286_09520 [Sphingobium sp. HDIP04]KER36662.1 hypothetical protein AL00_09310 [Sphingobium indicum F2]
MRADGIAIDLPDNPAPYLVDWLSEVGPLSATGMGPASLAWSEIRDWQSLIGIELTPWEARTLHRLSRDFHHQMQWAKKPNCPPPYVGRLDNDAAVTDQFRRMFARLAANQKAREGKTKR